MAVDMILAAMAFGSVYANLAHKEGDEVFGVVQGFAPPIFVLFFVLVGARLKVGVMTGLMWLTALVYVVGRTGASAAA
jgi:hypothetical protein